MYVEDQILKGARNDIIKGGILGRLDFYSKYWYNVVRPVILSSIWCKEKENVLLATLCGILLALFP